jgi:hypothetical protein
MQAEDPEIFIDIPINPVILASEQAYRAKGNPFSQLYIRAILEGTERLNGEIKEAREGINSREEAVLCSLLPRLVILTDLIAQNADFVALE